MKSMPIIMEKFLDLSEKHHTNTLAAYAIVRGSTDPRELRELRTGIGMMLAMDLTAERMTPKELQSQFFWRSDLIAAAYIVTSRIIELSAQDSCPSLREPADFCSTVLRRDEQIGNEDGYGVWMPDIELLISR